MHTIPRINVTPIENFSETFLQSIKSRKFLSGPDIKSFESAFAKYIGVKHAIAVTSGRIGMVLALESLKLKINDEVLLPAYTLRELIPLVKQLGLVPKFVDVNEHDFNMNMKKVESQITKKTKVIIATHLFGAPCEITQLMRIARKHNLYLVEDCTHALGAEYKSKKVGSIGDAGFFSFEVMKPINTLGGGIITTNDDKLAEKIRSIISKSKNPPLKSLALKMFLVAGEKTILNSPAYSCAMILLHSKKFKDRVKSMYQKSHRSHAKMTYKLANFQAMLGVKQLENIERTNSERIRKAHLYLKLLGEVKEIKLPKEKKGSNHIYYRFVITSDKAEKIYRYLINNNVDATMGNDIMQNCVENESSVNPEFSGRNFIIPKSIPLPISNTISESEIRYIAESVKE